MNRSILIVICDFLLVSLLIFSRPDLTTMPDATSPKSLKMDNSTNKVDAVKDLTSVMQQALEEERKNREQLAQELSKTRMTASDREKQVQEFKQQLQAKEEAARQLQDQQANLQQQYVSAQTNLETLSQQLQSSSSEALLTKEKLAAMEAEAKKKADEAAALQVQLASLAASNQTVLNEKQQLSTQLQVAQVEQKNATERVVRMTEEVKVERQEKAQLAAGITALASKSTQLAQEIHESRQLTPNTIFSDFLTNRVEARFNAFKSGFFGSTRNKATETVLVSDGTNTFALCHVQDTPLKLWDPGMDWEGLTGSLGRDTTQVPIQSLSFQFQDPRIVWMPVSQGDAKALGCKVYPMSADPFKFQDAVLIGAQEGYYGECRFQIDPSTPRYVKLDNSFLKGLFGKFNPSRGDLVFSKTGEFLGIMANSSFCMVIQKFDAAATFRFGDDVRAQHTGETLAALFAQVTQLPSKLQ